MGTGPTMSRILFHVLYSKLTSVMEEVHRHSIVVGDHRLTDPTKHTIILLAIE